jgi:hypothetical protein
MLGIEGRYVSIARGATEDKTASSTIKDIWFCAVLKKILLCYNSKKLNIYRSSKI